MSNVLILAETRDGKLRKVAFEAATVARRMADTFGGEVHALVAAPNDSAAVAEPLSKYGVDRALLLEHAAFAEHNADALVDALHSAISQNGYSAVIFSASVHGRDVAPRVAVRCGVGVLPDVVSLETGADGVLARHPVNTGKVISVLRAHQKPYIISLRPGMFTPVERNATMAVETLSPAADPSRSRLKVTRQAGAGAARLDLSEAPVIVSGGRGLKSAENFSMLEDLATAFGNAAVGCTRAVSDVDWRSHSEQIGQTGRTVSPDLYLAIGISGAIQHVAGMRTSRTIVAVNKDREAPIFKIADYGIVGDAFEVVPALIEEVKRARSG